MSKLKKYSRRILSAAAAFIVTICFTSGFFSRANGETKDFKAMAEEIVVLVNEARAEEGLKPLYMVPYLCDLAHIRARECISTFSHTRPNGELFITTLDDSLVPYSKAAENIAAGSDNAEATFEQWRNSPKHWAAIMNPEYTHIGVAVTYEQNSDYKYYWEQFFVATSKKLDDQTIPERYKTVPASSGDINGDADIDTFDLIAINRYLADDTLFLNDLQMQSADMFKDGVITSADAMVLRKYLLGDYKTLPVTMDMLMGGG
ncbi:MAG: SCP-like extracellular [Ruminococcus sp.]|nr:SCP-like extracellular [Ruminococcus sp.]